jgi:hypothetical protein
MATALQQYADQYKKKIACERIMSDLKKEAKKELNAIEGKSTSLAGVKFHMTQKLKETIYSDGVQKIIDDLKQKIETQKENAENVGDVTKKYSKTFDAEIPESAEEELLAEASDDYKKYFKVK